MPHQTKYYIHISDVQRYKACRQAWDWGSSIRSNLTPKDKYSAFFIGSMVHHGLEQRYRFNTPFATSTAQYLADNCTQDEIRSSDVLSQAGFVNGLLQHYSLWQRTDQSPLADRNFEFISPEHRFEIVLWQTARVKVILCGVFDGIVKDLTTGKFYLWEIKTTRSITEREKQLDLDSQTDAYSNAAQRLFPYELSGVVYTLIRKKIPETPKVLKNNHLEQKTNADTTAMWYLDAIKTHHGFTSPLSDVQKHFIKDTYGDYINKLAEENKYFKRIVVNRSQFELADSWQQLIDVTHEMISKRTVIYLNESYSCNYCLFRRPCIAKRQGRNYREMLDAGYEFNQRYADEREL